MVLILIFQQLQKQMKKKQKKKKKKKKIHQQNLILIFQIHQVLVSIQVVVQEKHQNFHLEMKNLIFKVSLDFQIRK